MEGYRLSPQQRDLLEALGALGSDYAWVQDCRIDVSGPLDLQRLGACLNELPAAEEILRTYYPAFAGVRVQVVANEPCAIVLEQTDLSGLAAAEQEAHIEEYRSRVRLGVPEEPAAALKTAAFKLEADRHVVVLSCVAPAADARSLALLAVRVARLYDGAALEPNTQYADVAEWYHSVLEDAESDAGARYWRDTLGSGLIDPEPLPPPPAAKLAFRPARVSVALGGDVVRSLDRLSTALEVGRRDVLLAAWAALLWRLNAGEEFILGVCSDARRYDELRECVGLLAKTLPLRVSGDANRSFGEHARAIAQMRDELETHAEHLDWRRLLGGDGAAHGTDKLKTSFAFLQAQPIQSGPVTFSVVDVAAHERPFVLKVSALDEGAQIRLHVWFNTAAVVREEAERLAARFELLLAHAVQNPETPVAALPVLADSDRVAIEANIAPASENVEQVPACVVARFLQVVAAKSDAPAVSCGDTTLSYGELDARSSRLAAFLLREGAGRDRVVGVCLRRSTDAIVAMLGALKAGAAYVPLDPEYPAARIAYVLEDSRAALLLTERAVARSLPELGARVVCLDDDRAEIGAIGADFALPVVEPERLAYVLYTSGSTGRPKGVEVTRANLAYSTAARFGFYRETPGAFLLLSSFAFDSSVAGIFWTLAGGGHLVVSAGDGALDPAEISRAIERHAVTHTLCLPSVYSLLLDTTAPNVLRSLRAVIVAGESCPPSLVEKHALLRPDARLFNEYGPTECTVWCTAYEWRRGQPPAAAVPIGRAIPGASVVALGPDLRPVPIGCKGELYVTGPGLTPGYRGRPDLTGERYVTIEVPRLGRVRAYRTGDIVRLRANGDLDFVGRRDFQVKINGHRIELEEVENTLRAIPGVNDAVAVIRQSAAGDMQLAAFLRLDRGVELGAIERSLPQALPRYMIPAVLQALEDFPRTPNGKVDRKALATVEIADSASAYVPPRDELEALQAEIWAELLNRDRVGVEDDFFRVGGHSILATRLIARLNDVTQLAVPIRMLFENPTIAKFTQSLRADAKIGPQIARLQAVLAEVG